MMRQLKIAAASASLLLHQVQPVDWTDDAADAVGIHGCVRQGHVTAWVCPAQHGYSKQSEPPPLTLPPLPVEPPPAKRGRKAHAAPETGLAALSEPAERLRHAATRLDQAAKDKRYPDGLVAKIETEEALDRIKRILSQDK